MGEVSGVAFRVRTSAERCTVARVTEPEWQESLITVSRAPGVSLATISRISSSTTSPS